MPPDLTFSAHTSATSRRMADLAAVGLLLLHTISRILSFQGASPIGDESGTYYWAVQSPSAILQGAGLWHTMHLYTFLVKGLMSLGWSLDDLRLLSVVCTLAGWSVVYLYLRKRTHPLVALAGLTLFTLVPFNHLLYDWMIRVYAMSLLWVTLFCFFYLNWCEKQKPLLLVLACASASIACIFSLPVGMVLLSVSPLLFTLFLCLRDPGTSLQKQCILLGAAGLGAVLTCLLVQAPFINSMLSAHAPYLQADQSGLMNALKGIEGFYKEMSLPFAGMTFVSLIVVAWKKSIWISLAALGSILLFFLLIHVLGIWHQPWAFGRIFYRYYHLLVAGIIIVALHTLYARFPRSTSLFCVAILFTSGWFVYTRRHSPWDKGFTSVLEPYLAEHTSTPSHGQMFLFDTPLEHYATALADGSLTIVGSVYGPELTDLATQADMYRDQSLILITKRALAGREPDWTAGSYHIYEYPPTDDTWNLKNLVEDVQKRQASRKGVIFAPYSWELFMPHYLQHLKNASPSQDPDS